MTEDEWLAAVGLRLSPTSLDEARALLGAEVEREANVQGAGDTALMRLCAAQLFIGGESMDIALLWRAREDSQDAAGAIDVQMLCVGGVDAAVLYCVCAGLEDARRAIEDSRRAGDLDGFSVSGYAAFLAEYYQG